jgi:hypothetical protein
MPEYMAFRLRKRRLIGDVERIVSDTDRAAIALAQKLTSGCEVVELWLDTRLVAELKPKGKSKRTSRPRSKRPSKRQSKSQASPAHTRNPRKPRAEKAAVLVG